MPFEACRQASEYARLSWPASNAVSLRQGRRSLWKLQSTVLAGAVVENTTQRYRYAKLHLKSFASTHAHKPNQLNGFESLAILATGFYNSALHRTSAYAVEGGDEEDSDVAMFFGLGQPAKAPIGSHQSMNLSFHSQLLAIQMLRTLVSSPLTIRLALPHVGTTLRRTLSLFASCSLSVFNEWRVSQGHNKVNATR